MSVMDYNTVKDSVVGTFTGKICDITNRSEELFLNLEYKNKNVGKVYLSQKWS